MKHLIYLLLLCFLGTHAVLAQQKQRVFFTDIGNFWVAYDSIHSTSDSLKQLQYLQKLYIDKGTPGLKAFMEVRDYTPQEWVHSIRRYPMYWASIRANTLRVETAARDIAPYLKKLKKLYPNLRPASIYFTVGALGSGGTTQDSMVLIGTELAVRMKTTDVSEFPKAKQAFLSRNNRSDPFKDIAITNIHEYVHTQEKASGSTLC